MSDAPQCRPQDFMYDPPPETESVLMDIDPRFAHLPIDWCALGYGAGPGPNFMQVYDTALTPRPKRNFFMRLVHRCMDAWSPARRRNRDRKLMPHPKPMVDLWWWIYGRFKGKAWRDKPWRVEIDYGTPHYLFDREQLAAEYPDWRREIMQMLLSDRFEEEDPLEEAEFAGRLYEPLRSMIDGVRRYDAAVRSQLTPLTDEQSRELNGTRPRRYRLVDAGRAIECLMCGSASYNPNDIAERYCGRCHHFHDDAGYPGRQREIMSVIDRDGRPPLQTTIE